MHLLLCLVKVRDGGTCNTGVPPSFSFPLRSPLLGQQEKKKRRAEGREKKTKEEEAEGCRHIADLPIVEHSRILKAAPLVRRHHSTDTCRRNRKKKRKTRREGEEKAEELK